VWAGLEVMHGSLEFRALFSEWWIVSEPSLALLVKQWPPSVLLLDGSIALETQRSYQFFRYEELFQSVIRAVLMSCDLWVASGSMCMGSDLAILLGTQSLSTL
jgi:hypothetical protein